MRWLRAVDRIETPWRNGGGVTAELDAQPAGSTLDDFAWRVSLAKITRDGPFSRFDGVKRRLLVLEGALQLGVAGAGVAVLGPTSAPFAFAGEAEVAGCVAGGAAMVLNVMWRGARAVTIRRETLSPTWRAGRADAFVVVLAGAPASLGEPPRQLTLEPLDAVVLAPGEGLAVGPLQTPSPIVVIEIGAAAL